MKTDELIRAIAQDSRTRRTSLRGRIAVALVAGGLSALLLYAFTLGPRPDLAHALQSWRFVFKLAFVFIAFWTAASACSRLTRPDAGFQDVQLRLSIVPLVLFAGITAELASVSAATWHERMVGTNASTCLVSIPSLSAASLVALLVSLRDEAPGSPAASGAAAGLLAATLSAAIYATHCPDDSPLFVAVWYSTAIGIVTLLGAMLGRKFLKW